jgi:hypothetical protein
MKVKLRIWSAIASFQKLGDQTDRVLLVQLKLYMAKRTLTLKSGRHSTPETIKRT